MTEELSDTPRAAVGTVEGPRGERLAGSTQTGGSAREAWGSGGPVIRGLVRLSLLERVSTHLLVRFLRPFEDYLGARGVPLHGVAYDHAWLGLLHGVLIAVDPAMPGQLQQALLDVADLASEAGHEAALHLAGERQLDLFGAGAELSAEDLAFRLYLEHGELFAASHARVQSQEARRFVDFFPERHRPMEGARAEPKRVLLIEQLRRWFAARNRSEYADVRVSESDDEVSFVIIHGRPPRNLSVITSPLSRERLSIVPDKQDAVIFEKSTGRLSINAQFPAEHDFYRLAIGKVFFGAEDHFRPEAVLDCSVLIDDPASALSATGLHGLDAVALREITLEAVDAPCDSMEWRANDLHQVLLVELPDLLRRERTVRKAKLALFPARSRKPKIVEIVPPNKLTYDRRTHEPVVREFLFARGFMRHPSNRNGQRQAASSK